MAANGVSNPFGTEPVEEVFLSRAPLVRVLVQVRFPRLAALAVNDDAANHIALALEQQYPVMIPGRDMVITITPTGVNQQPGGGSNWQLHSADETWQVTFGPEFVAVHTSSYTSRDQFVERLNEVVNCFVEHARPPRTDRIGVRYINRLDEGDLKELRKLVRPEMLGGIAVPTADYDVTLAQTISEALYELPSDHEGAGDSLHARWGQLAPGTILDPTLPPVNALTWVLDLDSFRMNPGTFSTPVISSAAFQLSDRAYRFFRWAVTDSFLERFGAQS